MRPLIIAAACLGFALVAVVTAVLTGLYLNRVPLFDPPGFKVRIGLYLHSNVAETGPDALLPELSPFLVTGDASSALRAVMQAANELGWQDVVLDEDAGSVRATVVSSLFRFRDDLSATVAARKTGYTEIRLRSASRVGRGDLGANAKHIMRLRDAMRRRGALRAEQP